MAEAKCPYCGGQYCDCEKRDETFEYAIQYYFCNGCKKHFSIKTIKQAIQGEWLLAIYLSLPCGLTQFYRDENGNIFYHKKVAYYDGDFEEYEAPRFSIHRDKPALFAGEGLDFWMGDTDDSGMIVERFELNSSLTQKALQNEAMRAIHVSGNSFVVKGVRNRMLLADVCAWIRPIIHATDRRSNAPKKGCYIATCVYGAYDCPQVWTLRRFRDNVLASTWYGRVFIRTYYVISPILVKWFGHFNWFKKLWRRKLDGFIDKLQFQGIEDTPYKDT